MKNCILKILVLVIVTSGFSYSQESYEKSKKLYSKNWKTKDRVNTKKWIDSKKRLESVEENKSQSKYHSSHFMNSRNTSRGNYPNVSNFENGNSKSEILPKNNSTKLNPLRIKQSVLSRRNGRTPKSVKKDKLFSTKIE